MSNKVQNKIRTLQKEVRILENKISILENEKEKILILLEEKEISPPSFQKSSFPHLSNEDLIPEICFFLRNASNRSENPINKQGFLLLQEEVLNKNFSNLILLSQKKHSLKQYLESINFKFET